MCGYVFVLVARAALLLTKDYELLSTFDVGSYKFTRTLNTGS
jgi:hypothetical protein